MAFDVMKSSLFDFIIYQEPSERDDFRNFSPSENTETFVLFQSTESRIVATY
jgi:hypothetical protein